MVETTTNLVAGLEPLDQIPGRLDPETREPVFFWSRRSNAYDGASEADGASLPGHDAGDSPRRGKVAVADVVHHHPIGDEPPGQRPECILLPGDPISRQTRG